MTTDRCRSCQAPIEWALTAKGRRILIDTEPRPDGNLRVIGDGIAISIDAGDTIPETARRVSHFATCPNANHHRRSR